MAAPTLRIRTPSVFAPLWERAARYKGAYGGRGSGKSHDRALASVNAMLHGKRVLGAREVQNTIRDSVKQLVEDKIREHGLDAAFDITRDEIRCRPSGGNMIFRGLQEYSAESIKSLEGYEICWLEEAQTLSKRSLMLLIPTIRAPGSEIWATWNPRYEHDPIDELLRKDPPDNAIVVRANWQDNPHFPPDLRADLERDRRMDILLYEHVWEGAYMAIGEGAYYADALAEARLSGRVCSIPIEREPPIHTAWDLGIDDTTAIWVAQPVGRELRIIDFYENRGEDAAHYARWLIDRGYHSGQALLPHDAGKRELGTLQSYEDHLRLAGLTDLRVLPRTQDLMGDIQRVRSFLRRCWFDEHRCKDGLIALGSYRVEMDEKLRTPKPRPVHDWSSHAADAFRMLTALTDEQLRPGTTRYDRSVDINTGARRDRGPVFTVDRRRHLKSRSPRSRLGFSRPR